MKVTEITELTKSRVKIYIDDAFAFVLYKGELRINHIKDGQEVDEADYQNIMEVLLPKRAKLRCMNLLKTKSYTRWQLTDKLKQGGYPEQVIEKALAYVTSYGYVNDEQYAKDYIEYHKTTRSRTRIMNDLYKKGILKETAENAWEETVGSEQKDIEQEQILKLLQKKHYDGKNATYEEKQKIMAFLFRRGFTMDAIRNALLLDITSIYV